AAAGGLALLAAAALLSSIFTGPRGPLARGVWIVSPLAWAFVAILVTDVVANARGLGAARGPLRARLVVGALVVSAVSLFAARGRLVPREHMWGEILASDPGNQPAAIAVAVARRAAGDRTGSVAVLHACAAASPAS